MGFSLSELTVAHAAALDPRASSIQMAVTRAVPVIRRSSRSRAMKVRRIAPRHARNGLHRWGEPREALCRSAMFPGCALLHESWSGDVWLEMARLVARKGEARLGPSARLPLVA